MTENTKQPKALVWITLFVMSLLIIGIGISNKSRLPKGIVIDTTGQPTIGFVSAKVHLVLFEEPKCVNCKEYTEELFPKIKQDFIDKQLVRYTIIPVSFLSGSMPAAVATLGVYYNNAESPNNDLFFKYIDALYHNQGSEKKDWVHTDLLVKIAQNISPAIDLEKLRRDIDMESYRKQIEKNTYYGSLLMGGTILTPTLYVNGVEVKDLSYEAVAVMINAFLERTK